jgi:hypothetical protein
MKFKSVPYWAKWTTDFHEFTNKNYEIHVIFLWQKI